MFKKQEKKNNAYFIVVDPYLNKTAKLADLHIKIRPGTDGALACALMHEIFKSKKADYEYLKKFTKDYELLPTHFKEKTPEWAENISGVPDKIIKKFANILCKKNSQLF